MALAGSSTRTMTVGALVFLLAAATIGRAQQPPVVFGGAYENLDARRQGFVRNWVERFNKTTGQRVDAAPFYDEIVRLSTKTTFEAVTHALMTTKLTDRAGAPLGDTLSLVEQIEAVKGEVAGASGDRQFRMYVRLVPGALDVLSRSKEFKRGADNSVYHKGYPTNYREQGGAPSIQFSIAPDGRRADIDVDYRSSGFPVVLFNGHLTSSNSDVRAGDNFDRHVNRWTGFESWWKGFFGVRLDGTPAADEKDKPGVLALPQTPRAGDKNIDVMVNDFLTAWLVEGNVVAAMGYVSERSYACLAQDRENPADFDRGIAPYQLMTNLKAAHEKLGTRTSLDTLTAAAPLSSPALRLVHQPHDARFLIYSVPDDVAAAFDCESQLTPGAPSKAKRSYGRYFGAAFYVDGRRDTPVALLWTKEGGFWKIVSWKVGLDDEATPPPAPVPEKAAARIAADQTLVDAARAFLDSWLIKKNYDAAFTWLSPKSYGCWDLERGQGQPASTSAEEAGRKLRASIEVAGTSVGSGQPLDAILSAAEPFHPSIRVMNHPYARVFSLASVPNALADAAECAARAKGSTVPDPLPLEYGNGFEMTVRFATKSGDAPVLRLLWRKENAAWRITSYGVELP